jgi:hypothetical protein
MAEDDLVPKIRAVHPAFPADHMRIIGEICVYWTAMEKCALQAVCETAKIDEYAGLYLGTNIPAGTLFDMLQTVARTLKEEDRLKDKGKTFLKLIEAVRQAYLLRNKYAHAHLRTNGPDKDPEIHFSQVARQMHIENRLLPLSELKADADAIFDACEALMHFLQRHGMCTKAWS